MTAVLDHGGRIGQPDADPLTERRAATGCAQALRPGRDGDEGVHPRDGAPRSRDDGRPGRGERLPRLEGRPDDRRDLSGGGDQHGRAAPAEGDDPPGEPGADGRLDRRVGRGRRGVHDPGVPDRRSVAVVPTRRCVLEIDGADDRRLRPRRALRVARAPRDGRGPIAALPRVRRGGRDPQGRPTGCGSRALPLLQHDRRRGRAPRDDVQPVRAVAELLRAHRRAREERGPPRSLEDRECSGGRGSDEVLRPRRQRRLHRRRVHHRARRRRHELRGSRSRVGLHGPLAHLLPGTAAPRIPARRRPARRMGRDGDLGVAVHRPTDRGRRHARGRRVDALPHEEEPRGRTLASLLRSVLEGEDRYEGQPHGALHVVEDRIRHDRRRLHRHGRALRELRRCDGRADGGGGHAHRGLLLLHGVGVPRRHDRFVEQSDLGLDALDPHHRGPPDGRPRSFRPERRDRRSRRRGGRLRRRGGRGRVAPGLQGRRSSSSSRSSSPRS